MSRLVISGATWGGLSSQGKTIASKVLVGSMVELEDCQKVSQKVGISYLREEIRTDAKDIRGVPQNVKFELGEVVAWTQTLPGLFILLTHSAMRRSILDQE